MSFGPVIQAENLVKVYPGGTRAVDGIDFSVARGEFFGLLGPNGAGKSTAMKVLSTLLKKTSGRAIVAGHDLDREPTEVRRSIGFAMQTVGLDDLATGIDFLILQEVLYGQPRREARERAEELLELVGLGAVARRKVGTYSVGMRRRLDLVGALMHRPPLLFLDEPTTGLDPQSRLAIWEHLERLNHGGVTILLTTQMMEEADRLCQRIAIIDHGRIVAAGSPQALKEQVGGDIVAIVLDAAGPGQGDGPAERAATLIRQRPYVLAAELADSTLTITVRDGDAAVPDLLRLLHESAVPVRTIAVARPTLDDVFFQYTGRTIRSEGTGGDEMNESMRPWLGLSQR